MVCYPRHWRCVPQPPKTEYAAGRIEHTFSDVLESWVRANSGSISLCHVMLAVMNKDRFSKDSPLGAITIALGDLVGGFLRAQSRVVLAWVGLGLPGGRH